MDGLIAVNGDFKTPELAAIPALDRGFLFGDNVFEVLCVFGSKILNIHKHLARLRHSADSLEMEIPWSDDELTFELQTAAEQLPHPKKYLRLVITRGCGMGLSTATPLVPNRVLYAFPAPMEPERSFSEGLKLQLDRLPYTEREASAKTGNYLRSILAMKRAHREGFDDVLWSNADREITEASTANIFLLGREGDLLEIATPSIYSGILAGITRSTLIELLNRAQIPVTERVIYADEIPRFDEAFVCSTVRGLIPVQRIGQHQLHTLRPNSSFQHIVRLHRAWVTSQLGHEVDWRTGLPTK